MSEFTDAVDRIAQNAVARRSPAQDPRLVAFLRVVQREGEADNPRLEDEAYSKGLIYRSWIRGRRRLRLTIAGRTVLRHAP